MARVGAWALPGACWEKQEWFPWGILMASLPIGLCPARWFAIWRTREIDRQRTLESLLELLSSIYFHLLRRAGRGQSWGVVPTLSVGLNGGPQIPTNSIKVSMYVCTCMHVCAYTQVHVCVWVILYSQSLSPGFYLPQEPPSTPQNLRLFWP